MTVKTKLRTATFLLTLSIVAFIYVVYLLAWPFRVLEIKTLPYPVKTPVIEAGDRVILDSDYCKYIPLAASYYAQFIPVDGGEIVTLAEKYVSNLEIGCKRVDFAISTPEDLKPKKYTIRLNIRYQVNSLRAIDYTFNSEPFEVIKTKTTSEKLDAIEMKIDTIISNWKLE